MVKRVCENNRLHAPSPGDEIGGSFRSDSDVISGDMARDAESGECHSIEGEAPDSECISDGVLHKVCETVVVAISIRITREDRCVASSRASTGRMRWVASSGDRSGRLGGKLERGSGWVRGRPG